MSTGLLWWTKKILGARIYPVFYAQIQVNSSIFLPNKPGWLFYLLKTKNIPNFFNILLKYWGFGSLLFRAASSFTSFHVLSIPFEPFTPLENTRVLHSFCAMCFRQRCIFFSCTLSYFKQNLMLFLCFNFRVLTFQREIRKLVCYFCYSCETLQCYNCCLHKAKHKRAQNLFRSDKV